MADSVTQQFLQANNFTNRLCHFSELMIVNRWPRCCGHFDSAASAHLSADRRNYAAANNMASVDKPAVDTQEPSVLSLADCRRLLAGARDYKDGMLPYAAVSLFAGLRPLSLPG